MAITLASNFDQTAAVPLDSRTVVADLTARDAIASGVRYEGLTVYVTSEETNFQLVGGIANGDWTELQGAGGGGINYILAPDGTDITGWAAYADAAGTSPVDGTGGSPATTFAVSTDSSLVGTENFVWTKSAADRQGEGFSYAFSIDSAYQSKPMTISALYRVDSGSYADNDMTVWVYDVTNAVLIQPSAYQIKNTTGVEQLKCEFQAASNSTSYRLIFHTASTSASAYTLRFDAFSISPNTYNSGAVVTDWKTWTPTGTWVTNSTYTGRYRRVGDSAEFEAQIALTGAPTSASLTISLPSGMTIDTTKLLTTTSNKAIPGGATIQGSAANSRRPAKIGYSSTTAVGVYGHNGIGSIAACVEDTPVTQASPITFANGDTVNVWFTVPIAGWGTSQVLSSDTDTRVVAASYTRSTGGATGIAIIKFNVKRVDTTSSYDTSTGIYTVPVAGTYRVSAQVYQANAAQRAIQIRKNSSVLSESYCPAAGGTTMSATIISTCSAGDTFDIYAAASLLPNDNSADEILTIERLSGPAQVAASESITASYTDTATTISGVTAIAFTTKQWDSHSSYSGSTFTAPTAGVYQVNAKLGLLGTFALNSEIQVYASYGGTDYGIGYTRAGGANNFLVTGGSTLVRLTAGQTLQIKGSSNVAVTVSTSYCNFSIAKVGNY